MSRRFASVLLMTVSASATAVITQANKPYQTTVGSSQFRVGTSYTTNLITLGLGTGGLTSTVSNPVTWSITTETWMNLDTGDQELRITHNLVAQILSTDTVVFEISFIPASQWITTYSATSKTGGRPVGVNNAGAVTVLGEDGGRCSLSINTAQRSFWTPTVSDIWYKCDVATTPHTYGTSTAPNRCAVSTNAWATDAVQIESTSTNNWSAPVVDNDADNPWCTLANTVALGYSPFQCKKIQCIMQRPLDTGDDLYDYQFDYATGAQTNSLYYNAAITTETSINSKEDYMLIQVGRARVWINSSTYTAGMAAPTVAQTQLGTGLNLLHKGDNGYIAIPVLQAAKALISASTGLIALCSFIM